MPLRYGSLELSQLSKQNRMLYRIQPKHNSIAQGIESGVLNAVLNDKLIDSISPSFAVRYLICINIQFHF